MLCGSGVHLFDGHHPDPEAILEDLIPANDEDGGQDARHVLILVILRPLEQDNRPPACFSFGLRGLEHQLRVPLQKGVQAQVLLRVRGPVVLARGRRITHPGQVVLLDLLRPKFIRFGFFGLAVLHLYGLLLVHRLHQCGQPLHIAPVLQGLLQAELLEPATESPHSKKRGFHLVQGV